MGYPSGSSYGRRSICTCCECMRFCHQTALLTPQVLRCFSSFVLFFCVLHQTRSNLYLGTLGVQLDALGDSDHHMRTFIDTFLMAAALFVPVIAWLIKKLGFAYCAMGINAVAAFYVGLQMVPVLWVQGVAGVVFTFCRCFLYSFLGSYIGEVFGAASIGKINGAMYVWARSRCVAVAHTHVYRCWQVHTQQRHATCPIPGAASELEIVRQQLCPPERLCARFGCVGRRADGSSHVETPAPVRRCVVEGGSKHPHVANATACPWQFSRP